MKISNLSREERLKSASEHAANARALMPKVVVRENRKPHKPRPPREPVGTALAARIEGLIGIKTSAKCYCKTLASAMDAWGIAGCINQRQNIVNTLLSHRGVLVSALAKSSWVLAFAAAIIPDAALRAGASWLLDRAIEDARNMAPPVRPPRQPRQPRPPRQPRSLDAKKFLGSLKKEQDRLHLLNQQSAQPQADPFDGKPVIHFGAHLWPVKGNWQWHVELWNKQAELINGKCFVGVAISPETDSLETIRAALHPAFIVKEFANNKEGENNTFRWLQEVVPHGQDDILIYCHGKGVRQHTAASEAVRRWSESMYETVVFNHATIVEKLAAGYRNVHSFRTFGTRPLSPVNRWHPSGTFFAVRAKYLPNKAVKSRYGGVEAWCGDHFLASESWCEFADNSMFTTLYDHNASRQQVLPALEEWRLKRSH